MIYAIIGSRDIPETEDNLHTLLTWLSWLSERWGPIDEVVSGGARGADRLGEMVVDYGSMSLKVFPADWSKGKGAGFARNKDIAAYADCGVAIVNKPLKESRGTANTVALMRQQGKRVMILRGF